MTLIGATTENPYFEVNSALLSRSRIYELEPLSPEHVRVLLDRAVGAGNAAPAIASDRGPRVPRRPVRWRRPHGAERARARLPDGGRRRPGDVGTRRTPSSAARSLYDRQADRHYDTISAWIKATRGSDPDASLYYLAVMLEGGEDPRFIVRRMVVLASEDIGNADPNALTVATAAAAAVEHVGMPEAQFALAQAAIYLSLAPKSDGAKRAVIASREYIREHGAEVPAAVAALVHPRRRRLRQPPPSSGSLFAPGADAGLGDRAAVLRARRRRGAAARAARGDPPRRGAEASRRRHARAEANLRSMQAATRHCPRAARIVQPRNRRVARRRRRPPRPEDVQAVVDAVAAVQPVWAACRSRSAARYLERTSQVLLDQDDDDPRPARPGAGQAADGGVLDGGPADDRRAAMDRPRRPRDPRRGEDPDVAVVPEDQALGLHVRAAGGDRGHLALELPVEHPDRRGRAGADGGQRRGAQAGVADSSDRRADRCECSRAPACPRGWCVSCTAPAPAPALAESSVGKVFFTGSVPTGRTVAEACARRLTGCVLELGGKDPMIVLDDARMEHAVAGALWGGFANAGQTCAGIERVYVMRSVAEPLHRRGGRRRAAAAGRRPDGVGDRDRPDGLP